jgi:hypothetical protein
MIYRFLLALWYLQTLHDDNYSRNTFVSFSAFSKIKLVQSAKMLGTGQHTTDKNELALKCPNIYRRKF